MKYKVTTQRLILQQSFLHVIWTHFMLGEDPRQRTMKRNSLNGCAPSPSKLSWGPTYLLMRLICCVPIRKKFEGSLPPVAELWVRPDPADSWVLEGPEPSEVPANPPWLPPPQNGVFLGFPRAHGHKSTGSVHCWSWTCWPHASVIWPQPLQAHSLLTIEGPLRKTSQLLRWISDYFFKRPDES